MEIKGNIHSLESFGTVDGPGIRFVVFMQGCPLRCLYCHNPDTWDSKGLAKYQMTPEELLAEVLRYKNFIAKGGVTVTGGEPLLQAEFLREFFRFLDELEKRGVPVWIRHVIVPGLTDNDEALDKLAEYISHYTVVQKAELLPYHTMGTYKYEAQGLDYKLKEVEPLSAERLANAKEIFKKHGITI